MALFPTTDRVITLGLVGYPGHKPIQLDVFPGRIQPRDGYTMDDAILAILASCLREHRGWLDGVLLEWTDFSDKHNAYEHPVARYAPGAVTQAFLIDERLLEPHAIVVRVQGYIGDSIAVTFLGTTTTVADRFFLHAYTQTNQAHIQRHLATHERHQTHSFALGLGIVEATLSEHAYQDILSTTSGVLARYARIGLEFAPSSGKAALGEGYMKGKTLVQHLFETWELRGTTLLEQRAMRSTPSLNARFDTYRSDPSFQAGQTIGRTLCGPGFEGRLMADEPITMSAHDRLALRALHKRVDTLLIASLPETTLRPMAAKKKAHLPSTAG